MASESYKEKNACEQTVRAVRHGNLEDYADEGDKKIIRDIYPFFPVDYPAENVEAWYTSKDYENMEEWSLYLFKDKTYLLTKYEARTISRVLCNAGSFNIDGEEDTPDYSNFTMVAVVGSASDTVRFVDGEVAFLEKNFVREFGVLPEESETTLNNLKTPVQYFPFNDGYRVEDVVAWYKQIGAPDNDFLVLYMFKDSRFALVQTKLNAKKQVSGNVFATGSYKSPRGTAIDFFNGTIQAYINNLGVTFDVIFVDGVGSVAAYNFTMSYQDVGILAELVGY